MRQLNIDDINRLNDQQAIQSAFQFKERAIEYMQNSPTQLVRSAYRTLTGLLGMVTLTLADERKWSNADRRNVLLSNVIARAAGMGYEADVRHLSVHDTVAGSIFFRFVLSYRRVTEALDAATLQRLFAMLESPDNAEHVRQLLIIMGDVVDDIIEMHNREFAACSEDTPANKLVWEVGEHLQSQFWFEHSNLMFRKAKIFVVDNDVLDMINDAKIGEADRETQLLFPFDTIWVEPANRSSTDVGWLISKKSPYGGLRGVKGLATFKDRELTNPDLGFLKAIRRSGTIAVDGDVHLPARAYYGYDDGGARAIGSFVGLDADAESRMTRNKMYTGDDKVAGDPMITQFHCTTMHIKLLEYLSSKHIEYEVRGRQYVGGSKRKRRQQHKSYHVVNIRKQYKIYLTDNPGVGVPLDHRVDVVRHEVRYRYCPNCEVRRYVRSIVEKKPCPECGEVTPMAMMKTVKTERGPFVRKPDLVAQVARRFYRLRADSGNGERKRDVRTG